MSALLRGAFSLLSPGGSRARLSVLIFHRVLPARDPLFPTEVTRCDFDAICGWLRQWFNVLPLDEASALMRDGRLPSRAASITFDDGYADNHDEALPVLLNHALPATFFVSSGFLDGGRMWNDTVIESVRGCHHAALDLQGTVAAELGALPLANTADRQLAIRRIIPAIKYRPQPERDAWCAAVAQRSGVELPQTLMMSSDQVRALQRAGMSIGAHTVTHPILARLDVPAMTAEIDEGRRALEAITGNRVGLFAYPNGQPGVDYGPEAVQIVDALGFDAAVSTAWGAAMRGSDRLQLPRYTPWDRTRRRFALRLARNLYSS